MGEGGEYLRYVIVRCDTLSVASRLEGGILNDVSIAITFDHDVLVATARLDGEVTKVIGVHLADGLLIDVDLYGWDAWEEGYGGFSR